MLQRAAVVVLGIVALLGLAAPAQAHGFESTVYAEVTDGGGKISTTLQLEYDLFVVSAADTQRDDPLFRAGTEAFEARDTEGQAAALNGHAETATRYVTERFTVASGGAACTPTRVGDFTMGEQEGVPYATLHLDWSCAEQGGHEVRSALFPATEEYVRQSRTTVAYDLDAQRGSATLDAEQPSFSTAGATWRATWRAPWGAPWGAPWRTSYGMVLIVAGLVTALVIVTIVMKRRSSRSGHSRS